MAPLIAAALKLLPLVPSVLGIFNKAEESTKLEIAGQVVNIAKSALQTIDVVPKSDMDLSTQLLQHPSAKDTFKHTAESRKAEWNKLALKDIQHAREINSVNHKTLVEQIASKVMRENVWFSLVLVGIQIGCMIAFGDNGVLLALVGNVIGVVIGQLLAERMQILSYLFGASIIKDKPEDGKGS
jgi:hypothetical protein